MRTKSIHHRFQDVINIALGIWLLVSPFYGFGGVYSVAAWNGYLFGTIIVLLSLMALLSAHVWEEGINMMIGIWLFVAPFVLGFYDQHTVMLNYMNIGAGLFGVSLWAMAMYPLHSHGEHISHVYKIRV